MTHNIAALYGHADDTLVAWQRACVQAAEALRPQHESERLAKALALAQDGHVVLEDDGAATVQGSGPQPYTVQGGLCDCPDAKKRGMPCKHALAVQIHQHAAALLMPSASPEPQQAVPPQAPQPKRQARARSSTVWDVHEAPASACFKFRVGTMELMYTLRGVDDAELQRRITATLPTLQEVIEACEERAAQRAAAREAQAAQAQQAPAAAVPHADLQVLLQQAVQHALAAQGNGQAPSVAPASGTTGQPPGAQPPTTPAQAQAADTPEGYCAMHQVQMYLNSNARGSWYSHLATDDEGQEYFCKGRPRRNGR
jgi:hypothetical protein